MFYVMTRDDVESHEIGRSAHFSRVSIHLTTTPMAMYGSSKKSQFTNRHVNTSRVTYDAKLSAASSATLFPDVRNFFLGNGSS